MLVSGCSDLNTVLNVGERLKTHTLYMYVVKSAHVYDLISVPDSIQLCARLKLLDQEKRDVLAVWVSGKRTK
jgi:hypothetical protein